MPSADKKPPAYTARVGKVTAKVWRNESAKNGPWHSVCIEREYVDLKGVPQTAKAFGRDDLPAVAEAARQAWLWALGQRESQ